MNYMSAEELAGKATNKYEAVVVAAMRARQLNVLEKKLREMEGPKEVTDEEGEGLEKNKKLKVTVIALKELVGGKIKFRQERG
jgi:DNA-directed RNA polymerase omega subunit